MLEPLIGVVIIGECCKAQWMCVEQRIAVDKSYLSLSLLYRRYSIYKVSIKRHNILRNAFVGVSLVLGSFFNVLCILYGEFLSKISYRLESCKAFCMTVIFLQTSNDSDPWFVCKTTSGSDIVSDRQLSQLFQCLPLASCYRVRDPSSIPQVNIVQHGGQTESLWDRNCMRRPG